MCKHKSNIMKNIINKHLIILCIIIISVLYSCNKTSNLIIPKNFIGLLAVKEWKAIGPFEFDTLKQEPKNTFNNKDLELYNIDEENFAEKDFFKLSNSHIRTFTIKCPNSPVKLFDHVDQITLKNKSNFYLYTNVYSESEQEVVFMFDGSRNYKVWINKVEVLKVLNKENTIKNGDRFLRVKLHKGNNLVFAKINKGINQYSWGILIAVTSENMAEKIFKENYLADFVNNPFISDSLSLYFGPYSKARLIIRDIDNNVRLDKICYNKNQKSFFVDCKELPKGPLLAELILGQDSIKELVYKGNMLEYVNTLKFEAMQLNGSINVLEDIRAAIDRLNFLVERLDESSEAGIRYYHRNILFYSRNLQELINCVRMNKKNSFFAGTILKTYYSKKDTISYHFLLHVDKQLINNKPMPLIFIIPYALVDESMTQSWYIGNLDQIALDSRNADKYGFAIAWLFMKGKKYQTSKDAVDDAKNAINVIKNDYDLDTTQIYLNGECVGGQRALLMAERCPDLFAGVSVKCPVTMSGPENDKPIDFIQNLINIPVCIQHGLDDHQVPIQNTRDFAAEANKYGQSIKVIETSTGHLNFTDAERRYNFVYFDSLRSLPKTKTIDKIQYVTFESPANAYWIKINKIDYREKAEINAKYDSLKCMFNVQIKNILNYSILLNKLNISPNSNISIYTNDILSYNGLSNKNEINISVQ